jgi:dATP pyrophosphohydrolase
MPGPVIRTDIVDVYVFRLVGQVAGVSGTRQGARGVEFLQMHRSTGRMAGTWQPVMGHIESGIGGRTGETAVATALRELAEETGYRPGAGLVGFWQIESVNTYFLAAEDCVMMSPCFAAQVGSPGEPVLDEAHDAHRWVPRDRVDRLFTWPGQRAAIGQLVRDILPAVLGGGSMDEAQAAVAGALRINTTG